MFAKAHLPFYQPSRFVINHSGRLQAPSARSRSPRARAESRSLEVPATRESAWIAASGASTLDVDLTFWPMEASNFLRHAQACF